MLVHITPGDPLVAVLPADASQELAQQLRAAYGFDRPLPVQFGLWVWRAGNGDFGPLILAVRGGGARGRQYPPARDRSGFDRPHVWIAVRPDRRLFPRQLGRQASDLACDRR